mmetsp:Transcript_49870/g.132464  ORF Transcript_49870/g.132464 Transcript_49870/m.132464 type:complete len:240 (-) Transcript_49870:1297-2016(-)
MLPTTGNFKFSDPSSCKHLTHDSSVTRSSSSGAFAKSLVAAASRSPPCCRSLITTDNMELTSNCVAFGTRAPNFSPDASCTCRPDNMFTKSSKSLPRRRVVTIIVWSFRTKRRSASMANSRTNTSECEFIALTMSSCDIRSIAWRTRSMRPSTIVTASSSSTLLTSTMHCIRSASSIRQPPPGLEKVLMATATSLSGTPKKCVLLQKETINFCTVPNSVSEAAVPPLPAVSSVAHLSVA